MRSHILLPVGESHSGQFRKILACGRLGVFPSSASEAALKKGDREGPRQSPPAIAVIIFGFIAFAGRIRAQTIESDSSIQSLKKLSIEQLMNVNVTSVARQPERLLATPSAIQVITNDDIRRSGATNLPEALRLASNLEVAQVDSRQWAISARGFNATTADKLLVMIDGRTVYTPLYAGVFWDVQDTLLEDVDRIEVISGPGGTQWGDNAVNGVINIITKSAKDTQGVELLGGGGSQLRDFGGVRYGGAWSPDLHYRVYGKYFDRASTDFADGRDGANDWQMGQGGFRMDWDTPDGNLLTLQGDAYKGQMGQPAADDITASGGNVLGRWSQTISDSSDFKFQAYFDRTNRRIPGTFAESLDTYDLDFQHHLLLGDRHNVVWGLGYRLIKDYTPADYPLLAFLPARVTRAWTSVFAQDDIALVKDRLNLTLGTKIEHNPYTGAEYQPSVRLAWLPSRNQTVWSAVSRAVRTPSRIDGEFYAPRTPPFFLLQGNPNFQSEKLIAYELGYRVQPGRQLSVGVAVFYNDYDRLRSTEKLNPPSPFPIFIANGQKGESHGVELTADWRVTGQWRLRAGYTELHSRIHPKPGSTDTSFGNGETHDPEHQFFLRSSLDFADHWESDLDYRYIAGISNQGVPAYSELDVRLGWEPVPGCEVSIVGQNLLHKRHAEFGALPARQEIERGVYGKVLCRF